MTVESVSAVAVKAITYLKSVGLNMNESLAGKRDVQPVR